MAKVYKREEKKPSKEIASVIEKGAEAKEMQALSEKSNVESTCSAPIKFHKLRDEERQEVITRIAKGEVVLQGPDSIVIEVKK